MLEHCACGKQYTKNVDINSGRCTPAGVDCLNDVGGRVRSGCVSDGKHGMARFCVDGNPIIWSQDEVGLCPFDPRIWFAKHIRGQIDLSAGSGSQASQELHVKLDLRWLCKIQYTM